MNISVRNVKEKTSLKQAGRSTSPFFFVISIKSIIYNVLRRFTSNSDKSSNKYYMYFIIRIYGGEVKMVFRIESQL